MLNLQYYGTRGLKALLAGSLSSMLMISVSMAQPLDSVVAIVNNQVITQSQLQSQITIAQQQMAAAHAPTLSSTQLRQRVLDNLINKILQLEVAKKSGVTVSEKQLNNTISEIAARNGMNAAQLESHLAQQGMSVQKYRKEIHDELVITQLQQQQIAPRITISEQEINDALRELQGKPLATSGAAANPQAQYHVIDILVPVPNNPTDNDFATAQRQAEQLLTQLHKGTPPASLVNQASTIEFNDLGWRAPAQLPNLFVAPIEALSAGQFSAPLRAPNGYHILQLVAIHHAANPAASQAPQLMQAKINLLMIKKTPLMTEAQMQARLAFLRNQIIATHNFASIAERNSQDPTTASKGGDMGWVGPGALPPQIDAAIAQLPVGGISQPIATPNGYYIVQVLGKRKDNNPETLRRDEAREIVYQRKYGQALQQWLQTLRGESYVKIIND